MSLLSIKLGNGKEGIVEVDTFTRMLNNQIYDSEEMRLERGSDLTLSYEYMGIAPSGSSTSLPVWSCIRKTWANSRCTRVQYKDNIAWSNKANLSW